MEDPYPGETGIFGIAGLLSAGGGGGYALKIVILVVLVLLSAFFSSAETAFTSVNRVRLKTLAQDGNKKAKVATMLVDRYDKMLYSTLIGNNIVNIAASSIATLLFIDVLKDNNLGSTVATIVTTVALLIFGEITPKTLAKMVPEKFCMAYGYFIYAIMIIFTPLSLVFSGWKALILKIFKFKPDEGITEEELITIVEEAGEEGSLDDNETHLIRSAIEFNDLDVEDIYVPRVNVIAVEKSASMQEIRDLFAEHSFSRLPVYEDNIDHIIGMIHEKDFYNALAKGHTSIESSITKIALATEHMKISTLLKSLQKQKVHMAVVVDEYGGTCGIVTLEDILEELVGEIWDEHDEVVEYFEKISDTSYIVDGNAEIDDFFELFSIEEEEECDANTVGGWVLEKLENLPHVDDEFTEGRIHVTVLEIDQTRVLKIRADILPDDEESDETEE
ncbi:MAG: HlyC/CorC family transporter [Clostridia bacterium]|nr:HlyC/CorC family transporter [Clostridia bacterium]